MAWRRPGDKPLSEPMMVKLLTHICVTRPQWVNSLWPCDAIQQHRSASTLAQIMTCCLTAPSHHLNKCWLVINKVHWLSSWGNFYKRYPSHQLLKASKISSKITYTKTKFLSNLPEANELTSSFWVSTHFLTCSCVIRWLGTSPVLVFYRFQSKVSDNERKLYTCNVFSHLLKPCSTVDTNGLRIFFLYLYVWFSQVSANERICHIHNVFSHWQKSCSAIDGKQPNS